MAVPWTEAGAVLFLGGILLMMGDAPVPTITPDEVEDHEGRTVRVAGFVHDVEIGTEGHRGILAADGHGIRFMADGTDPPDEGTWAELRGTLHREHGRLVLHVEADPWSR